MEGKAPNALFEHQATDDKTKELFAHLRKDDKWIVRDDVFIRFLDHHGPLTLGFGSPDRTGPELEFGTVMGNHFDEPVLLIKAAWGGHSLVKNFRPPSARLPSDDKLQAELEQAQQRVKQNNEKNKKDDPLPTMDDIKEPYGSSYQNMHDVLNNIIANHTGQPLDRIKKDTDRDFFLSAQAAKEYGIVDDILAKTPVSVDEDK